MSEPVQFPTSAPKPTAGNGNGGGWDSRLRAVENRLTAIETELRHRPTKADLEGLKNWMLLRLAGLILLGVAVITLIDRLLPQ